MRPAFESLVARAAQISDPQVTMGQLAEQWGVSAERVMDVLSALGMLDRLREDIMADPATWMGLDSTGSSAGSWAPNSSQTAEQPAPGVIP